MHGSKYKEVCHCFITYVKGILTYQNYKCNSCITTLDVFSSNYGTVIGHEFNPLIPQQNLWTHTLYSTVYNEAKC